MWSFVPARQERAAKAKPPHQEPPCLINCLEDSVLSRAHPISACSFFFPKNRRAEEEEAIEASGAGAGACSASVLRCSRSRAEAMGAGMQSEEMGRRAPR